MKISRETYIPNIPIPSGKRLQKTMENQHPIQNGKSTISMGHSFNSFFYVYQAGYILGILIIPQQIINHRLSVISCYTYCYIVTLWLLNIAMENGP